MKPKFYAPKALPISIPDYAVYPQWFGVNLVDMELPQINKNPAVFGIDYHFPSDQALYYLASTGMKLWRMDACWEYLQPIPEGPLDAGNLGRIDHLCTVADSLGCRVILSIMNGQKYTSNDGVQHIVGGGVGGINGAISALTMVDLGLGYLTTPSVSFTGGGVGATAVANVSGGLVTSITLLTQGTGYVSPQVILTGGSPTRAAVAYATVADAVITPQMMYDFWTALATHYHGMPGMAYYDIMNEPTQFATWDAQAQALINAIRAVDTTTTIIAQMTALWKTYNDPANNIVYSIHRYFDGIQQDAFPSEGFVGGVGFYHNTFEFFGSYISMGIDCAKTFCQWCRDNNVKGFFGEYGIPQGIFGSSPLQYDPRYLAVLDGFLATLQAYADCIIGGTYFSAGQYYSSTYYAASYNMSVLPAAASSLGMPDAIQMSVLRKYPTTG